MVRGSQRKTIFFDGEDYKKFLDLTFRAKEKTKTNIINYVGLPNHGHFIIQPSLPEISGFLRIMKLGYAKYGSS